MTFVPSTRTNGPAGRVRLVGVPATSNVSLTAKFVLFTATLNAALNSTFGIEIDAAPLTRPAIPALVRTRFPSPCVTLRKVFDPSPSATLTLRAPMRTILSVGLRVSCSNEKEPRRVWPAIFS